jgi:spheroidene monooxygenase
MQAVTLSLFRFDRARDRLWVIGQMALARMALAQMRDATFWKLCGSGTGEGFTPRPNWGVWAILACWPDLDTARDRTARAPVFARWRAHADEAFTLFLTPMSARGRWSGVEPFRPAPQVGGPLAALTRATLKPRALAGFWGRVPDISAMIGTDPNVAFKIGIGEVPMLHQVTFSIWPDAASMANFARGDGPHARAIRAVRDEGWFREELYARFRVLGTAGHWSGADRLATLPTPLPELAA